MAHVIAMTNRITFKKQSENIFSLKYQSIFLNGKNMHMKTKAGNLMQVMDTKHALYENRSEKHNYHPRSSNRNYAFVNVTFSMQKT